MIRSRARSREAIRSREPVVALETTLVAHGFPPGEGVAVALESEATSAQSRRVARDRRRPRRQGARRARGSRARALHDRRTQGRPAGPGRLRHPGRRSARRRSEARWPSAARPGSASWPPGASAASTAGERLGRLRRPRRARRAPRPLVVCSGVKSLLDVPATAELLEALGIPVLGYRTDTLPLFYCGDRRPAGLRPGSSRRRGGGPDRETRTGGSATFRALVGQATGREPRRRRPHRGARSPRRRSAGSTGQRSRRTSWPRLHEQAAGARGASTAS